MFHARRFTYPNLRRGRNSVNGPGLGHRILKQICCNIFPDPYINPFISHFFVTRNPTKIDLLVYLGHVPVVCVGEILGQLADHVILWESVSDAVIMRGRGVKSDDKHRFHLNTQEKVILNVKCLRDVGLNDDTEGRSKT